MPGITITSRCSRPFKIVLNGKTYNRTPDQSNADVFSVPTVDVSNLVSPTLFVADDVDAGGVTTVTVNIQEKAVAPPDTLVAANREVVELTSTSARVRWNVHNSQGVLTPASGGICYGTSAGSLNIKTNPQPITSPLDFHSQPIPSPGGAALLPDTTYFYTILGEDPVTGDQMPTTVFEFTTEAEQVVTGGAMTFAAIEAAGLPEMQNHYTNDHRVAEYLYQNPAVCYWDVVGSTVVPIAAPAMSNPLVLPAPSGGNDTSAVMAVVNNPVNVGRNFDGQNRNYRIVNAVQTQSGRLWNMNIVPPSGGTVFRPTAADVRHYNIRIDCQNRGDMVAGWRLNFGADRFHSVGCEYRNAGAGNNVNHAAVTVFGAKDYHFACNIYSRIYNGSGSGSTNRANAFWFNGGNNPRRPMGGGYIVNCTGEWIQSNGQATDGEFFTMQFHASENDTTHLYANRLYNMGKRAFKFQTGNAKVYSNSAQWDGFNGALGTADARLALVSILSQDNVLVNGNRFIIGGTRYWDYGLLLAHHTAGLTSNNCHIDWNDIQVNMQPASTVNGHHLFVTGNNNQSAGANQNATNSSMKENRVRGSGRPRYMYYTGPGGLTAAVDFSGNNVSITSTIANVRT